MAAAFLPFPLILLPLVYIILSQEDVPIQKGEKKVILLSNL